jgi:hypothetical protein
METLKKTHKCEMAQVRDLDGGASDRQYTKILFNVLVSLTCGDEIWERKVVKDGCTLLFVALCKFCLVFSHAVVILRV